MSDLEQLVNQLSHDNSRMRMLAASALGKMGNHQAISELEKVLNDESVAVVRAATIAIGAIGNCKQLDILTMLTQHDELWVRKAAVQAIGLTDCQDAVPMLVNLMADESLNALAREALVALKVDPDFF